VLFFASPFFEAALGGDWAETGRPPSMSSVITISQPPSIPGNKSAQPEHIDMISFAPMDPDLDQEDAEAFAADLGLEVVKHEGNVASESEGSDVDVVSKKVKDVEQSLAKLQSTGAQPEAESSGSQVNNSSGKPEDDKQGTRKVHPAQAKIHRRKKPNGPDAVIVLKEERVRCLFATTFKLPH
jgi:hypothetical protein